MSPSDKETRTVSKAVVQKKNSPNISRRKFLRTSAAAGGVAAVAGALSPLRELSSDELPTLEKFLQRHYKEMTPEEVIERIQGYLGVDI